MLTVALLLALLALGFALATAAGRAPVWIAVLLLALWALLRSLPVG
jgi:hypothetical protein